MSDFSGWKSEMTQRQKNIEQAVIRLADGMNNLREDISEMRTNHLVHLQKSQLDLQKSQNELKKTHIVPIYEKLEIFNSKLNGRPSWLVCLAITTLASSCAGLAMWIITH